MPLKINNQIVYINPLDITSVISLDHDVIITTKEKTVSFSASSTVCFARLDDDEIVYYVDKYRPFDKAGSYGIQEWIGYVAVEAINGSFYNVMGLPVRLLYQELKKF